MTEYDGSKEVSNFSLANLEETILGLTIDRDTEGKPALLRQMIWDCNSDDEVETVIKSLNLIPSSSDVWKKERDDSHERISGLEPIRPALKLAAENMAIIHTAKFLSMVSAITGNDESEIPEEAKQISTHNAYVLAHSSIISTLTALRSLGLIRITNE